MWNAAIRDFERDIIPMCKDEGMAIVPYGTLGQGRFQTQANFKARETINPGRQKKPSQLYKDVSKVMEDMAKRKDTQITSIAMCYTLAKAPYVFPSVGGRKAEHIRGNVEALKVRMTDDDIATIDKAYPFDPGCPHTFLTGTLFGDEGNQQEIAHGPGDVWLTNIMGTFDWVPGTSATNLAPA